MTLIEHVSSRLHWIYSQHEILGCIDNNNNNNNNEIYKAPFTKVCKALETSGNGNYRIQMRLYYNILMLLCYTTGQ